MKKVRWIACAAFMGMIGTQPLLAKSQDDMSNPWSPESVYYGSTLITNHPNGETGDLTADQVNRMRLTEGWLVGVKDGLEIMAAAGKPANQKCAVYLDKLTIYDLAKMYVEIKLRVAELNGAPTPTIAALAFMQDKSCGGDKLMSYMKKHNE